MITIFFWFFIFNLNKLLCNATKNIVAKVVLDYAEFCSQGLFNNLCATQQKKKKSALPLLLADFLPEWLDNISCMQV